MALDLASFVRRGASSALERRKKKEEERKRLERERERARIQEEIRIKQKLEEDRKQKVKEEQERKRKEEILKISRLKPDVIFQEDGSVQTPEELAQGKEDIARAKASGGTSLSAARQEEVEQQQQEAQRLGGQIGQFEELPVKQTDFDLGEAATKAAVEAVPSAIQFGAGGLAAGAIGAPATGGLSIPVLGSLSAAGGFAAGFIRSITSDFKDQRRDMNENPRIVLQDGKTNLQDLATRAATDPANRAVYVNQFNNQLALIEQAHRQIKLDTSKDVLIFERSEDVLADFEFFYSVGGERDILQGEMLTALGVPLDPTYSFREAEMAQRRGLL